jgi:hypothetical protein
MSEAPDNILLHLYKKSGLSQRKLAALLGKNFDAMHGRIYRAQTMSGPNEEGINYEDTGNRASVSSISSRIVTVKDLIEAAEIDLDVWDIERSRVNKWEGYRKDKKVDMTFDCGVSSGYVKDTGKLTIEPLFQVEIKLVKKEPVALKPVVSPVEITVSSGKAVKPRKSGWKRCLIITDPHFGFSRDLRTLKLINFHDRKALSVVLQVARSEIFDRIVVMGDVLDLADWSDKFLRSPEMYFCTQPAIVEASWYLGQLRMTTGGPIDDIEGNHDVRLKKSMIKHFLQAYDLRAADRLEEDPPMSVPALLGLERLGINYVGDYPKGRVKLNDRVVLKHGDIARGKQNATANAMLTKAQTTVGCGHIHRFETSTKTIWDGDDYKYANAFSVGCLCKIDGTVPGSKLEESWQQGFAVMNYHEDGSHHLETYPIENGRAFYQGELFDGYDYLDELKDQTGFNF